ncbi:2-hydroxychromene-2-carboxylate isomerase [Pseudotabrizicola sp. 4114]|uniref:2-hydroxychromene-2-carboxylate isomerase n=1 Tax=Pseudotabrizicola sp. 4114 TaxID=2817731 RepID=UPI0028568666|nr:2-hydroxychromene-2-carboxylate isomerase [Pseudorhodobacter sp. 4114]
MTHIDYFFATMSPYCYLAGTRLEEIAARHGATISYKPINPMALMPRMGGQVLADRHESRRAYRLQELRRLPIKLGMPLNLRPAYFPANAAPSSYAIIAAAGTGADVGPLVHAFCRAVWAEDRDISDDAVVKDILTANGFDPKLADSGMLVGAETFAANLEEAVARGVFGVPFYLVGEEAFWGQDRLQDLDLYLSGKL